MLLIDDNVRVGTAVQEFESRQRLALGLVWIGALEQRDKEGRYCLGPLALSFGPLTLLRRLPPCADQTHAQQEEGENRRDWNPPYPAPGAERGGAAGSNRKCWMATRWRSGSTRQVGPVACGIDA